MIYEELTKKYWMKEFEISDDEVPELLIIEESWNIGKCIEKRKSMFATKEKDIWFDNIIFGTHKKFNITYSCVYGPNGF
jgi:hypothetical protein